MVSQENGKHVNLNKDVCSIGEGDVKFVLLNFMKMTTTDNRMYVTSR